MNGMFESAVRMTVRIISANSSKHTGVTLVTRVSSGYPIKFNWVRLSNVHTHTVIGDILTNIVFLCRLSLYTIVVYRLFKSSNRPDIKSADDYVDDESIPSASYIPAFSFTQKKFQFDSSTQSLFYMYSCTNCFIASRKRNPIMTNFTIHGKKIHIDWHLQQIHWLHIGKQPILV